MILINKIKKLILIQKELRFLKENINYNLFLGSKAIERSEKIKNLKHERCIILSTLITQCRYLLFYVLIIISLFLILKMYL